MKNISIGLIAILLLMVSLISSAQIVQKVFSKKSLWKKQQNQESLRPINIIIFGNVWTPREIRMSWKNLLKNLCIKRNWEYEFKKN